MKTCILNLKPFHSHSETPTSIVRKSKREKTSVSLSEREDMNLLSITKLPAETERECLLVVLRLATEAPAQRADPIIQSLGITTNLQIVQWLAQSDCPGKRPHSPPWTLNPKHWSNSRHCMWALVLDNQVIVVFVQDAPSLLRHYNKRKKINNHS